MRNVFLNYGLNWKAIYNKEILCGALLATTSSIGPLVGLFFISLSFSPQASVFLFNHIRNVIKRAPMTPVLLNHLVGAT